MPSSSIHQLCTTLERFVIDTSYMHCPHLLQLAMHEGLCFIGLQQVGSAKCSRLHYEVLYRRHKGHEPKHVGLQSGQN